jgi:hypothetical protein
MSPDVAAFIIFSLGTACCLIVAGSLLYDHTLRWLWLMQVDNALWELEKRLDTLDDVPKTEIDEERTTIFETIMCAKSLNLNRIMLLILWNFLQMRKSPFAPPSHEKLRQIDDERISLLIRAVNINSPISWWVAGLFLMKPVSRVQRFVQAGLIRQYGQSCGRRSLQPVASR